MVNAKLGGRKAKTKIRKYQIVANITCRKNKRSTSSPSMPSWLWSHARLKTTMPEDDHLNMNTHAWKEEQHTGHFSDQLMKYYKLLKILEEFIVMVLILLETKWQNKPFNSSTYIDINIYQCLVGSIEGHTLYWHKQWSHFMFRSVLIFKMQLPQRLLQSMYVMTHVISHSWNVKVFWAIKSVINEHFRSVTVSMFFKLLYTNCFLD